MTPKKEIDYYIQVLKDRNRDADQKTQSENYKIIDLLKKLKTAYDIIDDYEDCPLGTWIGDYDWN